MSSTPSASDRWPLWLASALALAGSASLAGKTGALLLVAITLGAIALALVLASVWLKEGPRLRYLRSGLLVVLQAGALLFGLPELVAGRMPVNWEEKLGVIPSKEECPVFFRIADELFDQGKFVKRPGSEQWSGRPLNALLRMKQSCDTAYEDESAFTVTYDADGFRNPPNLKDWDVVIVGDSYVELGTLPDDQTIPGQFAVMSGLRVKNLGAAATAAQNHAAFLRTFGQAPSCKQAVLVWSEAEIEKTVAEVDRLRANGSPVLEKTGRSLLRAVALWMRQRWLPGSGCYTYANTTFLDASGKPVPVSIPPSRPPSASVTGASIHEALQTSLAVWASTARSVGMEPWLVFLPSPARIWEDRLSTPFGPEAPPPASFPADVAELCNTAGIRMVDATPSLLQASQRGELVYNPMIDHHPTRLGSELIARSLFDALRVAR